MNFGLRFKKGVTRLATSAIVLGFTGMSYVATAQGPLVPVFQKEVFPNTHDRPAIDEIEFEVKKGVRYFTIDVNSNFPWICEGEIHNVYADDDALASHGNTWYVRRSFNVHNVVLRYYVPSNHGYCSFIVKAYQ
jgi:hypothetical protein